MLTSLEIKNFRVFKDLRIERLGQVNLILGKNNVGKTTLLEALQVYASRWPTQAVNSILDNRDQVVSKSTGGSSIELESLFHTSGSGRSDGLPATIRPLSPEMPDLVIERVKVVKQQTFGEPLPSVSISSGGSIFSLYTDRSADFIGTEKATESLAFDPSPLFLRMALGKPALVDTARRWDDIALTPGENEAIKAIKLIAPILAIVFVADPRSKEGRRLAKVRLEDTPAPVPLASLGDGVTQIFQIAVAIQYSAFAAKAAREFSLPERVFLPVLIDEIEVGVHHTVHADMWRVVLKAAHDLGVQVFATTHSWDCLRGFAKATQEVPECDALAVRLERVEGKERTGAIIIDREDLPIVVRNSIEVR